MAKSKPVRVMVVGLGRIGWDFHAREIGKNPNFELSVAVDSLAERREEARKTYGCTTFATLDEALKSGEADLAVICTRSADHAPHAIAALKAGLHVLVEKPAAMSVREMDRMIKAAEKAGKILTVHQSGRKAADLRFVRETIDSKILGKVFWIRHSGHSFFRRNDWQQLKRFGGGYLNNNGVHAIDSMMRLIDSPVENVWGDLKHTVTAGDADDWLKVIIRGDNGRVIEVEQSYACAFPQARWLVCGTAGTLESMEAKTAEIKYFDPKKAPKLEVDSRAPVDRQYGNDDSLPWQEKTVEMKPKKDYPDFYEELYKSIKRGKKLLVTPESVRDTTAVLDAVRKSSLWRY